MRAKLGLQDRPSTVEWKGIWESRSLGLWDSGSKCNNLLSCLRNVHCWVKNDPGWLWESIMCRQKACHVVTLPKFKMDFVKYRTVCEPSPFLNLQTTRRHWETPTSELSRYLTGLPAFCVLLLLADLHFVLCSTPTWKSPVQKGKHGQTITAIYWPQCAHGPLLVVNTDIGPTPMGHGIDWDWVASLELMLLSWMWVCMCMLLFLFASMNV